MLGGTQLLTKLLLPALENASSGSAEAATSTTATTAAAVTTTGKGTGGGAGARVINVSSGGMYTVSGAGVAQDMDSKGVEPYDGTVV